MCACLSVFCPSMNIQSSRKNSDFENIIFWILFSFADDFFPLLIDFFFFLNDTKKIWKYSIFFYYLLILFFWLIFVFCRLSIVFVLIFSIWNPDVFEKTGKRIFSTTDLFAIQSVYFFFRVLCQEILEFCVTSAQRTTITVK